MMALGTSADSWNRHASEHSEIRSQVERAWERQIFRALLPTLENSELRVLLLIKSRTLDWLKYAEAIPMSHFLHGLTDADGRLLLDKDEPFCAGAGIRKEDTVRAALKGLAAKELIEIFRVRRGRTNAPNVYMPFTEIKLAQQILELGGSVPKTFLARKGIIGRD